jgi:tetratricopeptide (TPR) repeat protein
MSNPALDSALSLKAQRRYTEAAQALRSHLAQNPTDEEAQGLLMQIQELMMLELQIQQKLKRARGQLLEGDHAGARAIAEEILKMDPDHPEAKEILASAGGAAEPIDLQATMLDSAPVMSGSDFMLESAAPADAPGDMVIGGSDFALAGPDEVIGGPESPLLDASGFEAPAPAPAANLSAAENSKVRDFITRGQAAIAAGNPQDAIDIFTRVFIIDENNAEAQTLIDQARAQMDSAGAALDHEVNEAVGLFNAGDFMRAKAAFGEILKKSPNHAEALGYLGQIAQREHAQSAPALAADQSFEVDSGADAIPAAAPEEAPPPPPRAMPERPAPRPRSDDFGGAPAAVMAPSRPASSAAAGLPGWAKGAAAAMGLAALVILYFVFKPKPGPPPPPVVVSTPVVRSAPPPPPPASSAASAASAPSAPAPVLDPHQLEIKALADGTDVAAMMTAAKKEFADRHYDEMKTLLASILDKQPNHGDALKLKDDALHQQVEEDDYSKNLQHAITLLNQTEYEEALRIGWTLRFPEEKLKIADRLGVKEQLMAVWSVADYNTAIKALHNQNVEQAETYLTDYMDANPKDAEAKKVMEIVKEYKVKALDKTYYTTIQGYQYKDTPK